MIDILGKSKSSITISSAEFNILSYKIQHCANNSKYFTVSGCTNTFSKGINPVLLTIKAVSVIPDSTSVIALENALNSSLLLSFTIDGLFFSNMTIQEYYAECDKNRLVNNMTISFISKESITVQNNESDN